MHKTNSPREDSDVRIDFLGDGTSQMVEIFASLEQVITELETYSLYSLKLYPFSLRATAIEFLCLFACR